MKNCFHTCYLVGQTKAIASDKGVRLEGEVHGPVIAVEVRDVWVWTTELMCLPIVSLKKKPMSLRGKKLCCTIDREAKLWLVYKLNILTYHRPVFHLQEVAWAALAGFQMELLDYNFHCLLWWSIKNPAAGGERGICVGVGWRGDCLRCACDIIYSST